MNWLRYLQIFTIGLVTFLAMPACAASDQDWKAFKSAYIENGRVIDRSQNGISHSEGQGMAMLLAVQHNDLQAFKQLWVWTQQNLQVRQDKLFAWSWSPGAGINDSNNASDGDLFIAWALSKAYTKWQEPSYLYEAIRVSQSIREKLLRKTSKGLVILPGAFGFDKPEGLKLNLSYWVFPAIDELANLDPAPEWLELRTTGLDLIAQAQFGKWHLPPDWLILNESQLSPTDGSRFGYDAVRIPLYLIWGRQANPANLSPFKTFWDLYSGKDLPAWVDLLNNTTGTYNASIGFHSIAAMTLAFPQIQSASLPTFDPSQGYYSSMLYLFTAAALEDLKQ